MEKNNSGVILLVVAQCIPFYGILATGPALYYGYWQLSKNRSFASALIGFTNVIAILQLIAILKLY